MDPEIAQLMVEHEIDEDVSQIRLNLVPNGTVSPAMQSDFNRTCFSKGVLARVALAQGGLDENEAIEVAEGLKDRKGRTLTNQDIEHYQEMIVSLVETDRIMKEMDKVWTPDS